MRTLLIIIGRLFIMIFALVLFHSCAKTFNTSYNNVSLKIDSIVPANGTAGTPVRIYGTGFALNIANNKINFNGTPATIDNSNPNVIGVLLAYAPANGKTGNVSVSNGKDSATGPVFTYAMLAPRIQAISPATGYPFITVTITGNNFSATASNDIVLFNNVKAVVVSADTNSLQVQVPLPASYPQASIPVTVTVNGIASNGVQFQYLNYVPTITNINPASGIAGTQVTITGTNFLTDTSKMTVLFNGVKTAFISAGATTLTVVAPKGTTGNVSVTVIPYNVTATGPVFTYLLPLVISSISPTSGYTGTTVTITGSNFVADTSKNVVYFNGVRAPAISATATQIVVYAPNSKTGNVSVTTNGLTGTGPVFTYLPAPAISSISPASGQIGTTVTITGSNFVADTSKNAVYFNGVKAPVISATATQIVVYAPNSTTGNVSVTSNGLTGTGPVFTYVVVPVITGISFTAQSNFHFIISGNNFDPANSVVKFDGQVINGFVYNAGSPQTLSLPLALLPSNLGNPVQVTVTVNNIASNAYPFLFNPNIVSATPDTVQATNAVTLQGTFFGNTQGTSTLKTFYIDPTTQNKVYMTPSPTVVSWNTNTIQLTTPDYQSYTNIIGHLDFNIYFEVNVGGNTSNVELYYKGH